MGTEIELKLALAPEDVGRFKRHASLRGRKPSRRKLLSLYFDTPDFALSRQAMALRLRRVGYHWIQTVKAEAASVGALTTRPEWETQVSGNRPDLAILPSEALARLGNITEADLSVCFATEFTRTAWHIEGDGGALELALDQGEIRAGEGIEPISEVEFELKGGEHAHLFSIARAFLDDLPFTVEPRSKAERGYLLAGVTRAVPVRATVPRLQAGQDAGSAWRVMMASALSQLIANVPGVLYSEDPEYLHQARVAVRRLRTMLGLARSLSLDASLWDDDLRWLMEELSPARDWDVLVTETLPRLDLAGSGKRGMKAFAARLSECREAARERARDALTSGRFARLILEAEEGIQEVSPLDKLVEAWAREVLDRRLKRFKRLGCDFARLDETGRHALRIAAKRLRYSIEAFAGLRPKRSRPFIQALAELQDALGAANDLVVARRLFGEFTDTPYADAAMMIEGRLAASAVGKARRLGKLCKRVLGLKPYWR